MPPTPPASRRSLLRLAGLGSLAAGVAAAMPRRDAYPAAPAHGEHTAHALGVVGKFDRSLFDPTAFLRSWNFSHLRARRARPLLPRDAARRRHAAARVRDLRRRSRDRDRARCVLPGLDLQRTGARADDPRHGGRPRSRHASSTRARTRTRCTSTAGIRPRWTARCPSTRSMPGGEFVYEFDAEPFGLHLYHCHAVPLKRHIHKGLYGAFIVDPQRAASAGRRDGHGDERLRHQLRRRQRGLRGQHRRAHFHMHEPIRGRGRTSWCASTSST